MATPPSMSLFGDDELYFMPKPPHEFPKYDENIEVNYCCPRCQYKWSGAPKPVAEEIAADFAEDVANDPVA